VLNLRPPAAPLTDCLGQIARFSYIHPRVLAVLRPAFGGANSSLRYRGAES
jgi:hypothetical protein